MCASLSLALEVAERKQAVMNQPSWGREPSWGRAALSTFPALVDNFPRRNTYYRRDAGHSTRRRPWMAKKGLFISQID